MERPENGLVTLHVIKKLKLKSDTVYSTFIYIKIVMQQSNKCTVPLNDTGLNLHSFSCSPPETVIRSGITQYEQIIQRRLLHSRINNPSELYQPIQGSISIDKI